MLEWDMYTKDDMESLYTAVVREASNWVEMLDTGNIPSDSPSSLQEYFGLLDK